MHRTFCSLSFFCAAFIVAPLTASAANITIPTVPVGNPGNGNDPLTGNLYGAVAYNYRIGTTEVTNAQYAAFLNEKAKSDPLNLWSISMETDATGGITRNGNSGSFTYAARPNMGDKPVNYVTFYDSIRFANWLHNGQGTGDTETGAYTLLGGTATPSNALSITRNSGATWFLTSENEWYKAAYYQPAALGGDVDNYSLYATRSNAAPTIAHANSVGNISNPGANVANYNLGANWNGTYAGNVTTVGSAGLLSQSFYGTSDQGGNVSEWNETLVDAFLFLWCFRGGYYASPSLPSSGRFYATGVTDGTDSTGFRVATVPEPGTAVLAIMACALMWALRKRFK